MNKAFLAVVALAAAGAAGYTLTRDGAHDIVLTGLVTTNDVVVSPQIAGRLSELRVTEGDTVAAGQVIATLEPSELRADRAFYQANAEAMSAQLNTLEDELAAGEAQQREAAANLAQAKQQHDRVQTLLTGGGATQREEEDARTTIAVAQARVDVADKQIAGRRSALAAARRQQAAAGAQTQKADVRLGYTEITAPMRGTVSVRAARQGEMLNPGQPILTLVNPDSLWVRADVEETYIDRVRLGDTLTVRLPSGTELPGVVTYRGVDADFATQRDVSRTKRDIKTFELRLRVDNKERRLAVGMTAYVLLPVGTT